MTQSPAQVRATARVGADGPPRSGPAVLVPRRRAGRIGPVHVVQLLLAEAAVIAIVVAAGASLIALGAAVVVGGLLLVVVLGRAGGRWWLERRVMSRQLRRRRHSRPPSLPDDQRLAGLQWLAPGLEVTDLAAPDGSQIGVARDDAGWFAAAALTPSAPMRDDARPPIPLDRLVTALTEAGQPGAVAQVVTHTVPAPLRQDPAVQSYRELLQRYGPVAIPVDRVTWIAVRLDARSLAEVGADAPDETAQAPAVVAALLRRVVKALRREGLAAQPLDREALIAALARSCDLVPPQENSGPVRPREDWNSWQSAQLAHRSYWVRGWPTVAQATAMLDWLATAPAAMTNVALILAPDDDDVDLRCIARVSAAPDQLAAVCQEVVRGARLAHADVFPLGGEQGPAVYASAPTGGGPR